jgi:hypothetical protein
MHRDRLAPRGGHYQPGFRSRHARPGTTRRGSRAAARAAAKVIAVILWLPGHGYLRAAGVPR